MRPLAGRSWRRGGSLINVFLDSSALAKRYVQETGSERVEEILADATSLGLSVIALTEVISALCRRRREAALARPAARLPDRH